MTPAVLILERLGASFETVSYETDEANQQQGYGAEAAAALGVEADTVFKTLLASTEEGELIVGIVPVSGMLDLKALAKAAGAKKATMAKPDDAERSTGYVVGGISPLGQRKPLRTFIDEWAEVLDVLRMSGGRRGLEIELELATLLHALTETGCMPTVAPIAG